jgi:predicted glycosyltransferase
MKIAFHLAHPAHFHLFKNIAGYFIHSQKHQLIITYNEKDVLHHLIKNSQLSAFSKNIGAKRGSSRIYSLVFQFIKKEVNLYKILKREKPDLILGTSIIIAHVGKFLKIPAVIVNEDDFNAIAGSVRIGYPFCSHILAPQCCKTGKWQFKVTSYDGYHELAYLTPKYFKPDNNMIKNLKNHENRLGRYFILRFANLAAHHDIGKSGITTQIAKKLLTTLSSHGRVFITSERQLEPEFDRYRVPIDPLHMHHALYYADMYLGDSQTMTAEAAVLGTPALRFNDFVGKLGYLEELEHRYGLTYGIKTSEPEKLFEKIEELLKMKDRKQVWRQRRQKMLEDKIDVTAFMVWFIENYPDSVEIMKKDPTYQYRFK